MLYLIGLGLNNKNSSLQGLEAIKKCDEVYLENYTSKLDNKKFDFKFKEVDREFVENFNVLEAKKKNIAILIIGDVFSATTHITLYNEAVEKNIKVEVINNSSILTAVGITGLSLYNFGKTASIPFENKNVKAPIEIIENNLKINAHTLILLDLNPKENRYLSIKEGIEYLERNNFKDKIIGCARLGWSDFKIRYGEISKIKKEDLGEGPYCLIIPAKKLHFIEEESLEKWKS